MMNSAMNYSNNIEGNQLYTHCNETELQCRNLMKVYPNLPPANQKIEPPRSLVSIPSVMLPGNLSQYQRHPIEQQRVKLEGILETVGSS